MLGPAIALAWGLSQVNPRRWNKATLVAGALLTVLAGLSFAQLRYWRDAETVLQRTLAINPTSALAQNNMGQVYARHGEFDRAEQSFRASAMSNPDFVPAHLNLVIVYERMPSSPLYEGTVVIVMVPVRVCPG